RGAVRARHLDRHPACVGRLPGPVDAQSGGRPVKSYSFSRRSFLSSVGAAVGLVSLLDRLEAQEEGTLAPKRFLVVQRPIGTIFDNWWPTGSGTDLSAYTLSRILQPFEPLQDRMVVFRGLGLPYG